jgi:hypothetical protein
MSVTSTRLGSESFGFLRLEGDYVATWDGSVNGVGLRRVIPWGMIAGRALGGPLIVFGAAVGRGDCWVEDVGFGGLREVTPDDVIQLLDRL